MLLVMFFNCALWKKCTYNLVYLSYHEPQEKDTGHDRDVPSIVYGLHLQIESPPKVLEMRISILNQNIYIF